MLLLTSPLVLALACTPLPPRPYADLTPGGDRTGAEPAPTLDGAPGDLRTELRPADLHGTDRGPDRGLDLKPDTTCVDPCPVAGGLGWGCAQRFALGANWAWLNFGGDFGGIKPWNQLGVSGDPAKVSAALAAMKAAGVSVIRWWMFPRFYTDSISFGSDDAPSGIGGTLIADVQKALELAAQQDVYLMLTPFSFDGFAPTKTEAGIYARGLQPMVLDAARRKKLIQNLIVPIAKAVEASPHRHRMLAWDLINEPEWAMTGANLYGAEPFDPEPGLQAITHAQMETFLKELTQALRGASSALVTVGGAAIKWGKAWTGVGLDFYQLHYYDWIYEWYPYKSVTPTSIGLTGKPVVMGELPTTGLSAIAGKGLPAVTLGQLLADLWSGGYAGALPWAYHDSAFPWTPAPLQGFAAQHPCETRY